LGVEPKQGQVLGSLEVVGRTTKVFFNKTQEEGP